MILGVGSDVVEISRIKKLIDKFAHKFLSKIYSYNEIEQGSKIANQQVRIAFYAKRFAAKEAFSKALGLGIGRGFSFRDIEVVNDSWGKPLINFKRNEVIIKVFGSSIKIHLSLSDDGPYALGFVIIEKD